MNNNIKILHIIAGGLGGGAARGAYWLHLGLRELGVNSEILTNSKVTLGDENVTTILKDRKSKIENMIRNEENTIKSSHYVIHPKGGRGVCKGGRVNIRGWYHYCFMPLV